MFNYLIKSELYAVIRHKEPEDLEPDSTAEQVVKESYKDVIFSDKKFWDRANIEQVHQFFTISVLVKVAVMVDLKDALLLMNDPLVNYC